MRSGFLLRDFYAILLCCQLFAVPGKGRGKGQGKGMGQGVRAYARCFAHLLSF